MKNFKLSVCPAFEKKSNKTIMYEFIDGNWEEIEN